jgi:fluoride exporter
MKMVILVGVGGGMGSILRYLLGKLVQERAGAGFPGGTLAVNLLGCLVIGAVYALAERNLLQAEARIFLAVGLCGGFTTFSAFSYENTELLRQGHTAGFVLYTALSVTGSLLATFGGAWAVKQLVR